MKLYVVRSVVGIEPVEIEISRHSMQDALVEFGKLVQRWQSHLNEHMAYDTKDNEFVFAWPVRRHMVRDVKVTITIEHQHNYSS